MPRSSAAPTSVVAAERRRARLRRRQRHPRGHGRRAVAGGVPQRAALQRPPADALPGAAPQPRRRQHLDRPQGHRLVAHASWARRAPASARSRSPSRRIGAGQGDIFLVGGSLIAERKDILLILRRRRLGLEGSRRSRSGRRPEKGGGAVARLGRRVPRARGARACRGARQEALCAARTGPLRPEPARARARPPPMPSGSSPTIRKAAAQHRPLAVLSGATGVRRPDARGARLSRRIDRRGRGRYGPGDVANHARRQRRGDLPGGGRPRGAGALAAGASTGRSTTPASRRRRPTPPTRSWSRAGASGGARAWAWLRAGAT